MNQATNLSWRVSLVGTRHCLTNCTALSPFTSTLPTLQHSSIFYNGKVLDTGSNTRNSLKNILSYIMSDPSPRLFNISRGYCINIWITIYHRNNFFTWSSTVYWSIATFYIYNQWHVQLYSVTLNNFTIIF